MFQRFECSCCILFWSFSFCVSANFTTNGEEHPWKIEQRVVNVSQSWTKMKHGKRKLSIDDESTRISAILAHETRASVDNRVSIHRDTRTGLSERDLLSIKFLREFLQLAISLVILKHPASGCDAPTCESWSAVSHLSHAFHFALLRYWFKSKFNTGVRTDLLAIRRYIGGNGYPFDHGTVHANREVDAPRIMRMQSWTWNWRAGCIGSDERASSKNLLPEIFVILKWNCPHARMPWHGSLLPFEIVRCIGVSSPDRAILATETTLVSRER
jgi:hypothetical protein